MQEGAGGAQPARRRAAPADPAAPGTRGCFRRPCPKPERVPQELGDSRTVLTDTSLFQILAGSCAKQAAGTQGGAVRLVFGQAPARP